MGSFTEIGMLCPLPCGLSGRRGCPIQCSSDGKRIVYGTFSGVVSRCLPDQIDFKERVIDNFTGTSAITVTVAAISPDDLVIAGGDNNGVVTIWTKVRGGLSMMQYDLGMKDVRLSDLSFSDDSKRLAIAGVDRYSKQLGTIISVETGETVGKLFGHSMGINSISYRPKKPYMVATGGVDKLVCLHSVNPLKVIHISEGHTDQVQCVRFSPDGDQLMSCGADGRLISWDCQNGEMDHVITLSSSALNALAWSTDSYRIVVIGADRMGRIVEAFSGTVMDELILTESQAETPVGVAWTVTDWVCVLYDSGLISGHKTEQQRKFVGKDQFSWQGTCGSITTISSNPVLGQIVVGDNVGCLLVMESKGAGVRAVNKVTLPSAPSVVSIVLGHELLGTITDNGAISIFNIPTQREGAFDPALMKDQLRVQLETTDFLLKVKSTNKPYVRSIRHFADGKTSIDSTCFGALAATVRDGILVKDEVLCIGTHNFNDAPVAGISIDGDQAIIVACATGKIYSYPFVGGATSFHQLWTLKINGDISAMSSSLDGSVVAVSISAHVDYPMERFTDRRNALASTYLVEMYEVRDHYGPEGFRFVAVYELHQSTCLCLALNATATHLASADENCNICVVEIETGKIVVKEGEWNAGGSKITCLNWAPDRLRLVGMGVDQHIYVWDLEKPGNLIDIPSPHSGTLSYVQLLMNNLLLTAGEEGNLLLFELLFEESPTSAVVEPLE